jgi:hypothetical protein
VSKLKKLHGLLKLGLEKLAYLYEVIIWSVQVFVELDNEAFEERRELPWLSFQT